MISKGFTTSEYVHLAIGHLFAFVTMFFGVDHLSVASTWLDVAKYAAILVAGVLLFASTYKSYAASRGDVKAASVRRPVDHSPKRI